MTSLGDSGINNGLILGIYHCVSFLGEAFEEASSFWIHNGVHVEIV